ncbi:MAG: EAL domain-containing protein, partial [Burkholderiales bacterium]|nr:EAL domain-containing protein [Burkholderiales bacterium]
MTSRASISNRRQKSLWQRVRASGAPPIWLTVAMAILCIVVAVVWSANRADVVARQQERHLFMHALADRKAQILSEMEFVGSSKDSLERLWIHLDEAWINQQIGLRLKNQLEHTLVLLVEPSSDFVHTLAGRAVLPEDWTGSRTLRDLAPLLDSLVTERQALEADASIAQIERHALYSAARYQKFLGQPAIVAAALLPPEQERRVGANASPAIVMVSLIEPSFLGHIASRLDLPGMQQLADAAAPEESNWLELRDAKGVLVSTFAWTSKRPGAEIVRNVLPFIGLTLGGFILLAGIALRYMRRTRATIEAGEDRLRHMALHDPLSGLPNRTMFNDCVEQKLALVKEGGPPAALLSIDLDHFKDVNDTLGHHVGDALIASVAERLTGILRDDDLVARLGGDEFAVLTGGTVERAVLEKIGERIVATLSAPYVVDGHTLMIGASIGIVIIDQRANHVADIMRFADLALYRAKNEGRNRACVYDAAMSADVTQRTQLKHELGLAIKRDGLAVAYQPLVTPDGERMIGVEALCRWPHPRRGMVPPSEFIPLAEQSELIIPLGEFVLRRACTDGCNWPGLTVAVNVSPLQFRRTDFVETLERILEETGFDPARLELELTESTLLGNVEGAASAMRRIKSLGIKLALDDFGTGYSSLLYLRKFPFDKLKIDRSFVHNIETTLDAAAIVHAVVGLGRGLGMKVTAEGVENAEQQLFLRAAGVHSMQGYRFGRPSE